MKDRNDFTRRLFTGPDGINGLWNKQPGIYIRSSSSLDDLWRHFRKFTRVQDEHGVWRLFRFWDGPLLLDIPRNLLQAFVPASGGALVLCDQGIGCKIIRHASPPVHARFILDAQIRSSLAEGARARFTRTIAQELRQDGTRGLKKDVHSAAARDYLSYAQICGLRNRKRQTAFIPLVARYGYGFMHDAQYPALKDVLEYSRTNPAYALNLLSKWDRFIGGAELDPETGTARLATLLEGPEENADLLSRFALLNAAKAKMRTGAAWRETIRHWSDYYKRYFPSIGLDSIDKICLTAFTLGQYFHLDPYRRALVVIGEDSSTGEVTIRR